MTNPTDCLSCDITNGVAYLTLNRPQAANSLNTDLALALRGQLRSITARDDVQVIVLRGAGKGFCAGGDLSQYGDQLDRIEIAVGDFLPIIHEALMVLESAPQITVSAVQGYAAGAGMSLALMTDLCVMAEDAQFIPTYPQIGITPDVGGTYAVMKKLNYGQALKFLLLKDRISAAEALGMGLVTEVVPASELDARLTAMVERLAGLGRNVLQGTKRLLNGAAGTPLEMQLDLEFFRPAWRLARRKIPVRRGKTVGKGISRRAGGRASVKKLLGTAADHTIPYGNLCKETQLP